MPRPCFLYTDEAMLDHLTGPGHPERPDRLRAILDALRAAPLDHVEWMTPQPVSDEAILRVHTPAHLERLRQADGTTHRFDLDTVTSPGSVHTARLAAGGVVDAVEAVWAGRAKSAFSIGRPPGHHAEPDTAMGFCLLNHIAIGAAHAIDALGAERVLIVDWDVHHGNGTQAMFESRDDVLFFSVHQWPFYPGTGALAETGMGPGTGYTLNVPVSPGHDDADYVAIFQRLLVPVADAWRPDLILVSAGFDAHRHDPLGEMRLSETGFATLLSIVQELANRHAEDRLVLVLEGGYDLEALARSTLTCVHGLTGRRPETTVAPATLDLAPYVEMFAHHWPTLT